MNSITRSQKICPCRKIDENRPQFAKRIHDNARVENDVDIAELSACQADQSCLARAEQKAVRDHRSPMQLQIAGP